MASRVDEILKISRHRLRCLLSFICCRARPWIKIWNNQLIWIYLVLIVSSSKRLCRVTTLSSVVTLATILLIVLSNITVTWCWVSSMFSWHLIVIDIAIVITRNITISCATILNRTWSLWLDHNMASLIIGTLIGLNCFWVEGACRVLFGVRCALAMWCMATLHDCLTLWLGLRSVSSLLGSFRWCSYLSIASLHVISILVIQIASMTLFSLVILDVLILSLVCIFLREGKVLLWLILCSHRLLLLLKIITKLWLVLVLKRVLVEVHMGIWQVLIGIVIILPDQFDDLLGISI